VISALVLVVLCWGLIYLAKRWILEEEIRLKSVKTADTHILWFIAGYLYPIAYQQIALVRLDVLLYVLAILLIVLYVGRAFIINPVLQIVFRYKFYEVVSRRDFTYIVASRRELVNTRTPIDGRRLSSYMYLDVTKG
jgi:hypothetical protein